MTKIPERLFNVVNVRTRELVRYLNGPRRGEVRVFNSGALAAKFIATTMVLRDPEGKYKPQPVAAEPVEDWRKRERDRFTSGEYKHLLPSFAAWCPKDHFAHVSIKRPEVIAFTRSEDEAKRDIQRMMAPAAYLREYAVYNNQKRCELDRGVVEALASAHEAHFLTLDLKWASTPQEIVKVYRNYCPSTNSVSTSCMMHAAENYRCSPRHPVEAYGDSDLKLAYLENSAGKVIARAFVYEETKAYSRVYGSNDSTNKLHTMLKLAGYVKSCQYYGELEDKSNRGKSLRGARIRAIEAPNKNWRGHYIMPYVDEIAHCRMIRDDKGELWFLLDGSGGIDSQCTDGITPYSIEPPKGCNQETAMTNTMRCQACDDEYDCDDLEEVHHSHGRQRPYRWCSECRDNGAFWCNGYEVYFESDEISQVEVESTTYSENYADQNFRWCHNRSCYVRGQVFNVITDRQGFTEQWCAEAVREEGFFDPIDNNHYARILCASGELVLPDDAAWVEHDAILSDEAIGRFVGNERADRKGDYVNTDERQQSLDVGPGAPAFVVQ